MSERNDGGPAFPQQAIEHPSGWVGAAALHGDEGMTLLDYFAGQALVGMMASDDDWARECGHGRPSTADEFAKAAYDQADAMLVERRKREKGK